MSKQNIQKVSFMRNRTQYHVTEDGKILMNDYTKKTFEQNGYEYVKFSTGRELVHRIVAEAFCQGKTDEKNTVDHKDGNKLNNHKDNLEWVSQAENNRRYEEKKHG